jgi:SAM-dependent methyltransferase
VHNRKFNVKSYFCGALILALKSNKVRIAQHIEISWVADRNDAARCPNCGSDGPAPRLLEIDYRPPGKDYTFTVNACSRCGAKFFDNTDTMDYGTDELIEIGWHVYQIQIGAGLWTIARPLTRIDKPAGARMLEIGGAYGLGLDFGIRARDWTGVGYDPSPLAAFGASELGLDLKQDYFEEKDLGQAPYDVIIATEVIEHLPNPPRFLALMFRAIARDGILLLTTPDGEQMTPGLAAPALLSMLSPGAHLVMQTAASLRLALRQAGFAYVEIEPDGLSLIAYASASPFLLHDADGRGRALYRRYLLGRGLAGPRGSDLCFGFAGRGLFESVNDGDFDAAEAAWDTLLAAAEQRFNIDLERIKALPPAVARASLAQLHRLMPLGLGMILYSRALWLLSQGMARAEVLPRLRLAATALDALQAALGRRSLTDGLSADLRAATEAEIVLCLAEAGDPACVPAVIALWRRDEAHIVTAWRAFISLVNTASFTQAQLLQQTAGLYAPQDHLTTALRQDALFTTGVLALQAQPDWPRAVAIFAQLRQLLLQSMRGNNAPGHLFWPAVRGEVMGLRSLGRQDEADALLRKFIPAYAGAPADLSGQLPGADQIS